MTRTYKGYTLKKFGNMWRIVTPDGEEIRNLRPTLADAKDKIDDYIWAAENSRTSTK
jgi:hypothetical protein